MNEETKYDRYDKEKKKFDKDDQRMKFGKFYAKTKRKQGIVFVLVRLKDMIRKKVNMSQIKWSVYIE